MRKNPSLFRLTASVALTALLWDSVLPMAADGQPAPPPLPTPGEGRLDPNQADPPARVGRIASMTGAVSFHNPGDTEWSPATPNFPLISGNSFWTEPSAEAQLEVSDSRIAMAGGTEFDVATLDASGLQGVVAQGEIYIRLRDLASNEVWSMQTPRGMVRLSGPGRYDIVVGTTDEPTLVTAVDGAAQIEGPGITLQVVSGQTATITGTDSFRGTVAPAVRDRFLTASLDAERPRPAAAASIPAPVAAMCGGSDLVRTGTWSQAPEYGQVWYPPVAANWVPYREGHWAYVAPWGWTWVDDAPWGFAPFHYGRWLQIGGRWAWTPGAVVVTRPAVYAPALVTFVGIGAGVALGAALATGSIGWVPLGPHEPFRPWYHASNSYIQQVNVSHVTNINTTVAINNYVNRSAATSIPAAAMTGSRPVQAVARPVTAEELAAAGPIVGQQPIRPIATTAGVTPGVARELHLAPGAAERSAPGPVLRPQAAGVMGFARQALMPVEKAPASGTVGPERQNPGTPEAGRPVAGVRPADVTTPEQGRPAATVSEPGRPATPPSGGARPNEPRLESAPLATHPAPVAPRLLEQPAPQPEARPEPRPTPHSAPQTAHAVPRAEPQHAPPRPEPQRVGPPSHAEARAVPPAHPEPQEGKRGPSER